MHLCVCRYVQYVRVCVPTHSRAVFSYLSSYPYFEKLVSASPAENTCWIPCFVCRQPITFAGDLQLDRAAKPPNWTVIVRRGAQQSSCGQSGTSRTSPEAAAENRKNELSTTPAVVVPSSVHVHLLDNYCA